MIGIDITRISRFESMSYRLPRLSERFETVLSTPLEAAKWWACHEAVIKCLGSPPDWKTSKIVFKQGTSPSFIGEKHIALSLSHEGDLVVAVAVLNPYQM